MSLTAVLERAMREERHAEATYANVVARLGSVAPFALIVVAEQRHVATLSQVASAHGVDTSGITSTGEPSPATLADACALGVAAEKADGVLYDELMPLVAAYPDITQVMQQLKSSSLNNHLPAFQQCA